MNWLRSLVARSPKHATVLGKTLLLAGSIMVLAAVFARAGLKNLPSWFVPEGPVGFSVAAVLVIVGTVLTVMAENARKRRS